MKYFQLKYLFVFFILLSTLNAQSQIKVASGLETEIYHQFAHDINNNSDVPMVIYPSSGSLDNFEMLISDSIHMAFMQYDVLLYKALEDSGIKEYIKMFLPLYNEEIHLITHNNNKINSLKDLKGKKVGVGSKGAGSNITANYIKLKTEINWIDCQIPFSEAFGALLSDSIDAFFFVGAAPANVFKNLSADVKTIIKLISIQDERLDDIYTPKPIEAGTYDWANYDVKTYAVKSLLVVNTNNLDDALEKEIERLYNDLTENLSRIQKHKLSHKKWKQVDFTDLNNINWEVYKDEYVSAKDVSNWLAYIAAILTLFQIYFIINKLWTRKHERVVAESISMSAMFISILINSLFIFKNIMDDGIPQLAANLLWVSGSVIITVIGVGFWVSGNKQKGFFTLLKLAIRLERREAGDLAKAFFRPHGAEKIIDILAQVAMIDDELHEKEIAFIETFAKEWGIEVDWDHVEKNFGIKSGIGMHNLRNSMIDYLDLSPPHTQVSQVKDVLHLLVHADSVVAPDEEAILSELTGLIAEYIGEDIDSPIFKVAVVLQNDDQAAAINTFIKDLKKTEIAGGFAYLSEPFYSEKFAEVVCEKYRALNIFTVVIKPENISANSKIINTGEIE